MIDTIPSKRQQRCQALRDLALHREIKLTWPEQQNHLIKKILELPFDNAAERRLFSLELLLLIEDQRFPVAWNSESLRLLLQLHLPHLPMNGLEDLLIPLALREKSGRSFYPMLQNLINSLDQIPKVDLHWTLLLQLAQREISEEHITALFNSPGFDQLSSPKLYQVLKFDITQIRVLTVLLNQFEQVDAQEFEVAFYFLLNTSLVTDNPEKAGQLIHQFIIGILSLAEHRVNGFGQSYFNQDDSDEQGYQRILELFYLWLLHVNPNYSQWFFKGHLTITEVEIGRYSSFSTFQKLNFSLVMRYLPDFCLWEVGRLADENLGLLLHLAAGKNIRHYPGLCLPVPKKVAHAFHQLQPGDPLVARHLNGTIYQLFGQYLEVDPAILQITNGYFSFVWLRSRNGYGLYRSRHRLRFSFWKSVLMKWATWFKADPSYGGLEQADIWSIFGYIQHTLDENKSLPLKGATARSLHRRALNWRKELTEKVQALEQATAYWPGANYEPYYEEKDGIQYQIVQLTTAESLRMEGTLMKHCVLSYRYKCARGECSIWSLRKLEDGKLTSLVTMEISKRHHMVQVKGPCNQSANPIHRSFIKAWAKREEIWGG